MNFSSILKLSFIALRANKVRTALSVLGIVIGVMSVVIILSVGQGLKGMVMNQINQFGQGVMEVAVKVPGKEKMGTIASIVQGITITTLKTSDAEAMRDKNRFPYIESVSSLIVGQQWISYKDKEDYSMMMGTDYDYINIDSMMKIDKGRFLSKEESSITARSIVLGSKAAEKLFGQPCPIGTAKGQFCGEDPIGKKIKLKDQSLLVVGVLKSRGSTFGFDMDDIVYIPIETANKLILGIDHLMEIDLRVTNSKYFPQAKAELTRLMRQRHNILDPSKDDFQITAMDEVVKTIADVSLITNLLLGFLAAISLLVGGVGIMNIMLVSVAERTREIGLRKALGAKRKHILSQFLIESLIITGLGGAVGAAAGILLSIISCLGIRTQLPEWPITISWEAIIWAVGVATALGLIFGIYPARQAAKLDPIRALRYE